MAYKNFSELKESIIKNGNLKFKIKVIASSKENSIEFLDDIIKVKIREKPVEGKANKAIIEYFSNLFDIPKSKILISSGHRSSIKLIEINL